MLAALLGRRRFGRLTFGDALAFVSVVVLHPFVEWFLHRGVLHGPPRTVAGRVIDVGAPHRGHHRMPDDVGGGLLGGANAIADSAVVALAAAALGSLVGGPAALFTAIATGEASLASYEWAHLLHHSGYRPKTSWFRALRATHLRHHFRDDTVDFGVTSHIADRLLGTRSGDR